jgi:hypothetical protein
MWAHKFGELLIGDDADLVINVAVEDRFAHRLTGFFQKHIFDAARAG